MLLFKFISLTYICFVYSSLIDVDKQYKIYENELHDQPLIQDNVSVRSYLDCRWVSTDILRNNSLADTNDADLVIGYLFTGDLEHLILVPDSAAVVQQCSTTTISLLDRTLLEKSPQSTKLSSNDNNSAQLRRRHHPIISDSRIHRVLADSNIKNVITTPIIDVFDGSINLKETMIDDEDNSLIDGSGDEPVFEVEWSGWSECSVSCGTGIQTRHLQCVNPIGKTRPCPILETDHVEQRPCKVEWCKMKSKYIKNHKKKMLHKTRDFFPNTYSVNKGKFTVFKKHHIHKEDLQDMKACKCLNGGTCDEYQMCKCPEQFTGTVCEIEKQNSCTKDCQHGGICLNNKCICVQGYTGDDCSSEICDLNCEPGEVCPPATTCDCHDSVKLKCYNNTSCKPCLNGGECVKNKCKCLPGWSGTDCSIAVCKPACKNGGYCIKPNECLCRPGTAGNFCENDTCGSGCLNDGVCVGNSICKCPPNVTGTMCETVLCDPPCEYGATCTTDNICLCTPQMSSPRCAEKKCQYKAVRKPFNVGMRRLAKRKYSSHCKRNVAQCATRLVPKFQTMYKTLYRTVYECTENNTITNFLS